MELLWEARSREKEAPIFPLPGTWDREDGGSGGTAFGHCFVQGAAHSPGSGDSTTRPHDWEDAAAGSQHRPEGTRRAP